ncbi:MAG: DUF3048 domain-containing protein [Clostridia bacterium]|nr:DUF3048 domain-containing protein [Clostridia bacterium]
MKSNKIKNILCFMLLSQMLLAASCGEAETGNDTEASDNGPFDVVTVAPPETSETTAEPETEPEPETTEAPDLNEPEIINPLTGLEAEVDYENRRPLAIMINNIKVATPQEGISYADIMYECIVEGGQTRLMMVVSDYENLPVVGSVRSSREYYLDFAANHNAIYMHAGGSTQAYREIRDRGVNNLDGVNDNAISYKCFYRDSWRMSNMGYEHSLMTTGEKIVAGLEYKKYNTELAEDFDSPLDFVPYDSPRVPEGGDASYLKVVYSYSHQPYFEYNAAEGVYYRFQFLGDKHMDNTAGVQISFDNIIVLYCPTVSTNDSYNHMDVTTTGSGEGYYLYGGKYEKITWEKATEDTPVKLYSEAGEELRVNRGKTFFQICTEAMKESTEIR